MEKEERERTPPYTKFPKEWMTAILLFSGGGRCNGTDMAILMHVAMETWGWTPERSSADVSLSVLRTRISGSDTTLSDAIKKLCKPARKGGAGLLRVVAPYSTEESRGRLVAIETDWMVWAWPSEEALARCTLAMAAFRDYHPPYEDMANWRPLPDALDLAKQLRVTCLGLVPQAEEIPDDTSHPVFRRWCQTLATLMRKEKRTRADLSAMIRFVGGDPFWRARILGEHADLALEREHAKIYKQWYRSTNPDRG